MFHMRTADLLTFTTPNHKSHIGLGPIVQSMILHGYQGAPIELHTDAILDGHRRIWAAALAGISHLPVVLS